MENKFNKHDDDDDDGKSRLPATAISCAQCDVLFHVKVGGEAGLACRNDKPATIDPESRLHPSLPPAPRVLQETNALVSRTGCTTTELFVAAAAAAATRTQHTLATTTAPMDRLARGASKLQFIQKLRTSKQTAAVRGALVCAECADEILETTQDSRDELATERFILNSLLLDSTTGTAGRTLLDDLQRSMAAEMEIECALARLEAQRHDADLQVREIQRESAVQNACEHDFWLEYAGLELNLRETVFKRDALYAKMEVSSRSLERLVRTNVYNDIFRIWHDGKYGTINGVRLGGHSAASIDWPEINAGWGQACLLLDTLAKNLGYEFRDFVLVPLGSRSRIQSRVPLQRMLDLHGSGEFLRLGTMIFSSRFDAGMCAFLSCLGQLGEYCHTLDREFKLAYPVVGDTVGGISVRLRYGDYESWTRACKYILTNLKFLIAATCERNRIT